jgi:hypothetical protein
MSFLWIRLSCSDFFVWLFDVFVLEKEPLQKLSDMKRAPAP